MLSLKLVDCPNTNIYPSTAQVNSSGHLSVGGCDVVDLAERFGTPLWIIDETTICNCVLAYKQGLSTYPKSQLLYAGKAFLCLAMCRLIAKLGLGLDVVSSGELFTAAKAGFPPELIYMHGNNKSRDELLAGLALGKINIVVDSMAELALLANLTKHTKQKAKIFLRIIPGVEPDTHQHISTGHNHSKFGLALSELPAAIEQVLRHRDQLELLGLHTHIGSQAQEIEPYLENIDILVSCLSKIKTNYGLTLPELDIGGGLGITYTSEDHPASIYSWTTSICKKLTSTFPKHNLELPRLLIEPGRSIIGTAGITIYRAGHKKELPGGPTYIAVDGGMADNPRPIIYGANYCAARANCMNAPKPDNPMTIVGKYCESGDIIVKDAEIAAESGDLICVFGTGAYSYSMASNYNRTGRPACVLVSDGKAEVIIERESIEDIVRFDKIPERLM